jgi:signal transduction histidine kinase
MRFSILGPILGIVFLHSLTCFGELYSVDKILEDLSEANKTHLPTGLRILEDEFGSLDERPVLDQLRLMVALSAQYSRLLKESRSREVIERALFIPLAEEEFERKYMEGLRSRLKGDLAVMDLEIAGSIGHYKKAELLFRELDQWEELGDILNLLGDVQYASGQYLSGNEAYREAAKIFGLEGNRDRLADVMLASSASTIPIELSDAMRETLDVLAIYKASGNLVGESHAYQAMSYDAHEDPERPIELAQKAYSIAVETGDKDMQITALTTAADLLVSVGRLEEARDIIEQSLQIRIKQSNAFCDAHVFRVAGVVYTRMGGALLEQAKGYFYRALSLYEKMGDVEMVAFTHLALADYYIATGDVERAIRSFDLCIDFCREYSIDFFSGVLWQKQAYLAEIGRFEEALQALTEYVETVEKQYESGAAVQLELLQKEYEAELKTGEIQLLETENQLKNEKIVWLEAERKQEQRIRFFTVLVLILAVAIIIAVYFLARTRRIAVQNAESLNERLKLQNDELMEVNVRLKLINDQRNDLLRFGAHDLKNPLASMITSVGILRESIESLDTQKQQELLELSDLALESGEFMKGLIQKIMESQIAEARVDMLNQTTINGSSTLMQIVEMNRLSADRKSIKMDVFVEEGMLFETDGYAFKEIVDNLLSNAIKYTPAEGRVRVALECPNDTDVILQVQDSGPGVPEDEQKELFRPFAKLSPKPTDGESSNGLGLSIAKTLVTALDGTIEYSAAPLGGAQFSVVFQGKCRRCR